MNPQPTGKARGAQEQGAKFTAWPGRGLAGFVPCSTLPKGKAASSSLPIPAHLKSTGPASEHSC